MHIKQQFVSCIIKCEKIFASPLIFEVNQNLWNESISVETDTFKGVFIYQDNSLHRAYCIDKMFASPCFFNVLGEDVEEIIAQMADLEQESATFHKNLKDNPQARPTKLFINSFGVERYFSSAAIN